MTRQDLNDNTYHSLNPEDYHYIDLLDYSDDTICEYFTEPDRYEYYVAWFDYIHDYQDHR